MNTIKNTWNQWRFSLKILKQCNGYILIAYIILQVLSVTLPMINLCVFRLILDGLGGKLQKQFSVYFITILYLIVELFGFVSQNIKNVLFDIISDNMMHHYEIMVMKKSSCLPLEFLDSVQGRNRMDEIHNISNTVCNFPFLIERIIIYLYSFFVAFLIVFRYSPFLSILFLLISIPGVIWNNNSQKKIYGWNVKAAPDIRKCAYYRWMLTDA